MASNRPMFDDEDLPAWLKAAGITYGGRQGQPGQLPPSPAPVSQPGGDELPWASEEIAGASEEAPWLQGAAPAEPLAPASGEALPWLEDVAPAQTALPAAPAFDESLPWESAPGAAEARSGEQAPGEMDWQQLAASGAEADSSQAKTGVTGMLPWKQGAAAPQDQLSQLDSFAGQGGSPWDNLPTDSEPDWLQDSALSPEQGQPQEPVAPSGAPATPISDDLSWLDEVPQEPTPQPAAPAAPSSEDFSWLDEAPQEPTPQAAEPLAEPSSEDFGWLDEVPQEPTPQPAAPAPPSSEDFSWLDEAPQEPTPQAAEPPAAPPAPAPIKKLPKAETGERPAVPPPGKPIRPLPPAAAAAETPPPAIKRLPPKPQPPEQASPDLSSMTYEEWEQSQIAKEQEAQSDPGDKLLDEVPEWFGGAAETPPPTPGPVPPPGGPEFMPDWYLGMEEQSQDAAPDWFTDMDLSSTALAGPETVQTPPEVPEPAQVTPADDVPDWFKGVGVDNLDFNSLFGAQSTEPAPEPANWMADLPDLSTWEPEESGEPAQPAQEPEAAAPEPSEPAMDWFAEPEVPQQAEQPSPQAEQPSQQVEPEQQPEADLLDWMATEGEPETSEQSGPAMAEEEIPAWMQEIAPEEPEPWAAPPAPPAPEPVDSDVPAWLREEPTPEVETPAVSEAAPDAALDWLADFEAAPEAPLGAPAQPAQPPAPEPAQPVPTGELDLNVPVDIDGLLSLLPTDYTPSAAPVVPVEQDQQALAHVDTDFDLDALLGPPPDESQAQAETIDLDALGAQLAPPAVPAAPGEPTEPPRPGRIRRVPASAPQAPQDIPRPREELPEWIAEMRPSEAPVSLHIGDQEVRVQEKPTVPMNDQLRQLRERGHAFRDRVAESPTPTAGPLSGITGAIQTIPEAIQPAGVGSASALVITDAQARHVKIIHKVLELEETMFKERAAKAAAEPVAPAARRVAGPRPKFDRYVITLLLAVVMVVPFFWSGLNIIPAPDLSQLTPAQASVASAVDTIQPQQLVLVAFEYGPTGAGELDDLARTILRDIIKRGGLPLIVSTNPAGAMRAQALMALMGNKASELQLMNRTQPLVARQDYVVLRYLPGGAAGVRSVVNAILSGGFQQQIVFSTDIEGKALALDNIASLKDSPAFIIAENADDVRNWAEQYQAPAGEKALTMVLLTSAGASAVADTYVRTTSETDNHIVGPLAGFRDMMTYQAMRQSPSPGAQKLAAQRWQSIGLSALLAGVVIVIGMGVNMIRSLQRRRHR